MALKDDYATFDKKMWFLTFFALIGWGLFVGFNVANTIKKCPECPSCPAPAAVEIKK